MMWVYITYVLGLAAAPVLRHASLLGWGHICFPMLTVTELLVALSVLALGMGSSFTERLMSEAQGVPMGRV